VPSHVSFFLPPTQLERKHSIHDSNNTRKKKKKEKKRKNKSRKVEKKKNSQFTLPYLFLTFAFPFFLTASTFFRSVVSHASKREATANKEYKHTVEIKVKHEIQKQQRENIRRFKKENVNK
jgi:hypothetical protein